MEENIVPGCCDFCGTVLEQNRSFLEGLRRLLEERPNLRGFLLSKVSALPLEPPMAA